MAAPDRVLRASAPAKLNLFLHVLGRREDGYHELQTVFQLIDLCDDVEVRAAPDGRIERAALKPGHPLADLPPEKDLAIRAALALQAHTGTRQGAVVRVTKRIPAGGGLGGGSSDAATVLRLLNRLWDLRLGEDELAALGLTLGADVPVFVHGRSAWGEGRGERLVPVALPPRWFLVLHPGIHVATAAVFGAPELRRDTPPVSLESLLPDPLQGTRNDCEPVVRARHPEVAAALDWLSARAPARLTGTGACLFAAFGDEQAARRVAEAVPPPWCAFVCRGMA